MNDRMIYYRYLWHYNMVLLLKLLYMLFYLLLYLSTTPNNNTTITTNNNKKIIIHAKYKKLFFSGIGGVVVGVERKIFLLCMDWRLKDEKVRIAISHIIEGIISIIVLNHVDAAIYCNIFLPGVAFHWHVSGWLVFTNVHWSLCQFSN